MIETLPPLVFINTLLYSHFHSSWP